MLCSQNQICEYKLHRTTEVVLTVNWAQLRHRLVDAWLWLWLCTGSEKMKDEMQQHEVMDTKTQSMPVFLGYAMTWNSCSEWGRRFGRILQQWCTKCQDFAPGRIRKYTHHESVLAVETLMQSECCQCELEMFRRIAHQEEDPAE